MDLKFILDEIEKVDPEVYEKLSPRRHVLKSFGSKVAVAALPFALGSMFKKAYGRTTSTVIDALNFALQLEYLEYNFYHACNISPTLVIPGTDQAAFNTIESHELAHVNFLRNAINNAGSTPYTPNHYSGDPVTGNAYVPTAYDFTAGGAFPVYTSYATFLTVSQAFEDTGVRAYKGQAGNLISDKGTLQAALQIHSVEARHASHIRLIRRKAFDGVVLKSNSGAICVELIKQLEDKNCVFAQVPVSHYPRLYGKSQFFNFKRLTETIVDVFTFWCELVFQKKDSHGKV